MRAESGSEVVRAAHAKLPHLPLRARPASGILDVRFA
jgi:hypothetical protein